MTIEANEHFSLSGNAVAWLQRHPEQIRALSSFREAAKQLATLPLSLLPTDDRVIVEAAEISSRHGLLTNDAVIVALMHRHNLVHLLTNDDDFDRVPGLTVWKPRLD